MRRTQSIRLYWNASSCRATNNLRFIEMQRAESLVILFRRCLQRSGAFPPSWLVLLRPNRPWSALSFLSRHLFEIVPAWKDGRWNYDWRTENGSNCPRSWSKRETVRLEKKGMRVWSIEGGETARPDIALSKLTSHLTSAWEVKISLEVLSRTATVYLLPRFEKRKISGDFIVRRDGRSLVNFLLMHRTKNR